MAEDIDMLSCADEAHEGPRRVARRTFPPHPARSDWLAPWCGACAARRQATGSRPPEIPEVSGEIDPAAGTALAAVPTRAAELRRVLGEERTADLQHLIGEDQ